MRRRWALRAVAALTLVAPALAETVVLRSGAELAGPVSAVDANFVTLADGRRIARAEVREIRLAEKKSSSQATVVDPSAAARGRELFARADAMAARHPGADGVQLVDEGRLEVRADGTWVERDRFAGMILKDGLKDSWGTLSRDFEEGRERVRVIKALVYHRDGSVYSYDPKAVVVSAPQADALFFQDTRTLTLTLPQVEVGSIVEWELETDTYNPFRKDFFFPNWGFQGAQPSYCSRVSVSVPASRRLYYETENFNGPWKSRARPRVTTSAGRTTYAWRLDDIPAIVSEPNMVPYFDYAPSVKFSLIKDWAPIDGWLSQMYVERLKAGPELSAFARALTRGAKTDDQKVAAIYHWIQREVRYIAVKMGAASGWGGFSADTTFKKRYGCCIDKALLFAAMLRAVGIPAEPVLLNPNDEARHEFRVPDIWFSHAITRLKVNGRWIFLDSTGSDYRYPELAAFDHGARALDPLKGGERDIPVPAPEHNLSDYDFRVTIDAAGAARVEFSARYNGAREGELRGEYKSMKDSERRRFMQDWANGVSPSAELISYRLDNLDDLDLPFTLGMTYRLKDYLVAAGDLRLLKLPDFQEEFPEVALARRRYALQYSTSLEKRWRYEVALPAGMTPVSVPRGRLRGPDESFSLDCESKPGKILCRADFSRARRVYPVSDYAAHKRFLDGVAHLMRERIFLKAAGPR